MPTVEAFEEQMRKDLLTQQPNESGGPLDNSVDSQEQPEE